MLNVFSDMINNAVATIIRVVERYNNSSTEPVGDPINEGSAPWYHMTSRDFIVKIVTTVEEAQRAHDFVEERVQGERYAAFVQHTSH